MEYKVFDNILDCEFEVKKITNDETSKFIISAIENAEYYSTSEHVSGTQVFYLAECQEHHMETLYNINGYYYKSVWTNSIEGEEGLNWFYNYIRSDEYIEKFGHKSVNKKQRARMKYLEKRAEKLEVSRVGYYREQLSLF